MIRVSAAGQAAKYAAEHDIHDKNGATLPTAGYTHKGKQPGGAM